MATHRTRVGLHARNAILFPEQDYELMRLARIEVLKMMSLTDSSVYERLHREQPNIEFIVRLYDDRIRRDSRPSPAHFVARMTPIIRGLKAYATKFEIHNEPNHASGIEGWGPSDDNAQSFRVWYLQVLSALRQACPWARFGFPGLALNQPHRDLAWLEICKDAVQASDWLGCHCYWQYGNMFSDQWGLRFKLYHQRFPTKQIEITEFGNSTPNLPREEMARQYVQYYQELNKYPYLGSANSFIASSPDPAWVHFVWMKEGGEMLPVVHSVGNMERKPVEISPPPPLPSPPEPEPEPLAIPERTFAQTGKTVRGKFLEFFDRNGLDICGYPITEQFEEDGLQSQYFQRLALEEVESGMIQLKLVGAEAWASRSKITKMEASSRALGWKLLATGPNQPPMEDIVEDLLTHPTRRYAWRSLADIQQIVIHHTATSPSITPQRLAQYQVQQQGRAGIIYHFCVAANGTIYWTNRLETVSDHAYSQNQCSVGICFPGNFTATIPTGAQLEAGGKLCAWLLGSLRLPSSAIVGLGEFVNTQSPGKQWLSGQRWKDKLMEIVEATMEASAEGQAAIIASLREQITALEGEIEALKQQLATASFSFSPGPAAAKISQPAIQDLIDKLPKHSTKKYNSRALSNIRHLVIHHSAVPPSVGPQRIAAYHVNKQDWPGIGYHFLVGEDGSIYQGNALETVSYHAVKANPQGVGICFLGNFSETVPPPDQLEAGAHLIAWLIEGLGIALDQVKGHKEFMDTACPGEQWLKGEKWKEMLRKEITKVQEAATQPSPTPTADGKALHHYLLFWARDAEWAKNDWLNAQNYIGAFRPTAGFSIEEAVQAEYVTIVGGPLGVSRTGEEQLKAAGCRVERIAGKDEADTKRILDDLVKQGRRFENLKE
jgi:N-acetyl-anhydromuramyl-L-alanine amidase AmpD